jgi:hypothetical protein
VGGGPGDDVVAEHADALDLGLNAVAGLQVVPGDVVRRLLRAEELAGLADDDGQLELVVELLGQAFGSLGLYREPGF